MSCPICTSMCGDDEINDNYLCPGHNAVRVIGTRKPNLMPCQVHQIPPICVDHVTEMCVGDNAVGNSGMYKGARRQMGTTPCPNHK